MLTYAQVSVNTRIPCCSGERLAVFIRNMLPSLGISESLRETKVNYIHQMLLLADADQEIVWLYISVYYMPRMKKFYSWQLLTCKSYFTIWSANIKTVFRLNLRPQKENKSSKLGPSKSITMKLYSPELQ